MKNYFNHLTLSLIIAFTVLSAVSFASPVAVQAESMSISKLIELLISIEAIAPDKVTAARSIVDKLSQPVSGIDIPVVATTSAPLPYIQVLKPNGGESWESGVVFTYPITWGSSSQIPVIVSLVPTKGEVCNLTPSAYKSRNSNNTLDILVKTTKCYNLKTGTSTSLTDGTYKVRVSYTNESGVTVKDESDATFKILPVPLPAIKVVYPNGAEKLVSNDYINIKYSLVNTPDRGAKLYIVDYVGGVVYSNPELGVNGVYRLRLPSALNAGAYKVRLEMTNANGTKIEDTSDGFFWISDVL